MLEGTSAARAKEFLKKIEGIDYGAWLFLRHAIDRHFDAKKSKLERELQIDASLQLDGVDKIDIP